MFDLIGFHHNNYSSSLSYFTATQMWTTKIMQQYQFYFCTKRSDDINQVWPKWDDQQFEWCWAAKSSAKSSSLYQSVLGHQSILIVTICNRTTSLYSMFFYVHKITLLTVIYLLSRSGMLNRPCWWYRWRGKSSVTAVWRNWWARLIDLQ